MRLSTERDRDDARAIGVLHAALDAGVAVLDTADAYCWDDREVGHNERLVARALASWSGDATGVVVATKGGLTRPDGRWVADGRARHLTAACEASLRALGVERIGLYQLHAPDPRTPLSTSVRALASLKQDRLIEHIGLCNVTAGQIEDARRLADIDAVQVELSIWNHDNLLSGVAEYCVANEIRLIAHRPLGGPRRALRAESDALLADLATRHEVGACDIALAWLLDLSQAIVPIAGATRVETASALARLHTLRLTEEDRARLDERFPGGQRLRRPRHVKVSDSVSDSEVVLIMGLPGAGKTTAAQIFVEKGYARLNRDEDGRSLRDLLSRLDGLLQSGASRIVLDNTYVSRKSRAPVIESAARAGLSVRCVWLQTGIEDAQVNASSRMLARYGRLLGPEEMRLAARTDVSAFGPAVQFRHQREIEPPHLSEGFSTIDIVPFERRRDPSYGNRAVVLWCDDVLIRSRSGRRSPSSPEDVETVESHGEILRMYLARGWQLLGLSWRPEIAEQKMSVAEVNACFDRMIAELGVPIDVRYCPHAGGPPVCWCRKPLPGLGALFIQQYRLDPTQSLYVGQGPQDPGFARRLGFQYREADAFFSQPPHF